MLGPVPALTVSWANYFLLPASLTLPAFSCPARTSAHFMQSNVKVQEIWGNVKSHLLCESMLADDRCQDLVTFPFCLNQHLAVLQTPVRRARVVWLLLTCDAFHSVDFIQNSIFLIVLLVTSALRHIVNAIGVDDHLSFFSILNES